jgi:hypothetical protein
VAYCADELGSQATFLGPIGTRQCDIGKRVRKLQDKARNLAFVYEPDRVGIGCIGT